MSDARPEVCSMFGCPTAWLQALAIPSAFGDQGATKSPPSALRGHSKMSRSFILISGEKLRQ